MKNINFKQIKKELIKLAKNNTWGNPFSACIIYKNEEYYNVNSIKYEVDPTEHAEIKVIRMACEDHDTTNLKGAILISSAEPCPMCLTAIAWAGIKDVYFIDSYKVANKKGFKFDNDAEKVNKFLKLGLNIKQI